MVGRRGACEEFGCIDRSGVFRGLDERLVACYGVPVCRVLVNSVTRGGIGGGGIGVL